MNHRFLSILFSVALLICLAVPALPLRVFLLLSGGSTSISSARWLDFALLEVRGIHYRDALRIDSLTLRLSPLVS